MIRSLLFVGALFCTLGLTRAFHDCVHGYPQWAA